MAFDDLPLWSEHKELICHRISNLHGPFKIILKTKDDPVMLRKWVEHHTRIVGLNGLMVCDNMSTDSEVEAIYETLANDALVFRYRGFHNDIHYTDKEEFCDLYKALSLSCQHFIFLDTDERLFLFDGDAKFHSDARILSFIEDHCEVNIFPCTWLQNIAGYDDRFSLYDPVLPLSAGLKWGKPIISVNSPFGGFINHNTQLPPTAYTGPLITNFFVLHLSQLSLEYRISANLKKLRAYGEIGNSDGIEKIMGLQIEDLKNDQTRMYVREIFQMMKSDVTVAVDPLLSVQIAEGGVLIFGDDWQRRALRLFVLQPETFASELFL